jgi:hypothetical protein
MTRLAIDGMHRRFTAHHPTDEDHRSYVRWARSCYVLYSLLFLVALLVGGISLRGHGQPLVDNRDATVGMAAVAAPPVLAQAGTENRQ